MLACADIYGDGGYDDTVEFLRVNGFAHPKASDYGIDRSHVEKMTNTALGMEKLWLSHFGEGWKSLVDKRFVEAIYERIVSS